MPKKIIDIIGLDTFKSELIKDNLSTSDSTYSSSKITEMIDDTIIANSISGSAISVSDSADGTVQGLTVYGRSRVSKNLLDTGHSAISNFTEDSEHYVTQTPNTSDSRAWNYNNSQYFLTLPAGSYKIVFFAKTQTANTNSGLQIRDSANNQLVSIAIRDTSNAVGSFTLAETTAIGVMCKQYDAVARFMICTASAYEADPSFEPYGIISIGDSGSLTIATANSDSTENSTATLTTGLPYCGIPVTTGETYTDGDGVKWLADTADVEGVVKRCGVDDLGDFTWNYDSTYHRFYTTLTNVKDAGSRLTPMVCSTYTVISDGRAIQNIPDKSIYTVSTTLYIHDSAYTDAADFKTAVTGVKLVYPLATPTTQELTSAEKTALLSLKTYDSTTNFSVTDDPYVDFDYLKNTQNGKAVATAIDNAITKVLDTAY